MLDFSSSLLVFNLVDTLELINKFAAMVGIAGFAEYFILKTHSIGTIGFVLNLFHHEEFVVIFLITQVLMLLSRILLLMRSFFLHVIFVFAQLILLTRVHFIVFFELLLQVLNFFLLSLLHGVEAVFEDKLSFNFFLLVEHVVLNVFLLFFLE